MLWPDKGVRAAKKVGKPCFRTTYLLSRAAWIVECCRRTAKIYFIFKFFLYFHKQNKKRKCVNERERLFLTCSLSVCLSWNSALMPCSALLQ